MDPHLQRGLHDKLYEKRKAAALELERLIRDTAALPDSLPKLRQIVDQLCTDTYSSSHPHIRNGGLIGLAAACIALGPSVARFLEDIIPPVLACFTDQDSRVRYYACESMYNIAKVAKGETLLYFNEVFDSLCRLAADSELSVKNGAELLDRLVKDIVSEKAATYVSVLQGDGYGSGVVTPVSEEEEHDAGRPRYAREVERTTAFSLERFIPMLAERIYVINPFTRTFLVSWIILLNSIPDLELITHLPAFLDGLLKFLADPNKDVRTATHVALNDFLAEIRRIAEIKKISGNTAPINGTQTHSDGTGAGKSFSDADSASHGHSQPDTEDIAHSLISPSTPTLPFVSEPSPLNPIPNPASSTFPSDIYIPGQDVPISHPALLQILLPHLSSPIEEIQHTALTWVDELFRICGQELLEFVPRVLERVLPVLSSGVEKVRGKAGEVSGNLRVLVMGLPEAAAETGGGSGSGDGRKGSWSAQSEGSRSLSPVTTKKSSTTSALGDPPPSSLVESQSPVVGFAEEKEKEKGGNGLDYATTVNALTLQFLNEHEETRVAALDWLYWLHKKAPTKVLAMDDGTFPVLLKTLSDPSEKVVTRDLQLLALVSSSTSDDYFTSFMLNLVSLFSTDRRLLEIRGSLIVRQLCVSLSGERIYRTLAEILERDDDLEFAGIMVQNLSMGLITAPELGDLRKRLRNLETKDGQLLFTSLYRSWCHNAVATFSLCLLAQAYEQASNLLQIFADLEITVSLLIQVDKLVQLLESPVFTYLRLQLLEPEKYPYLFKCLYGLLMLLPQSSAFATLRNRLNAVNSMGFIHLAPKTSSTGSVFERGTGGGVGVGGKGRKGVDEIKWPELLEKFRNVQLRHEKARRAATLKNPPVFAFDPLSTNKTHETPNSTFKESGVGKDGGPSRGGSTPGTPTTAGPGAIGKGHGRSKSIGLANRLYQARQKRKE